MNGVKMAIAGLLLGVACAAAAAELWPAAHFERNVPLYFSMEVRQGGHVVARPQLVGASGHLLKEVLRRRDGTPRMALSIAPTLQGQEVGVDLDLSLPGEPELGKSFSLRHGQQVVVRLSPDVTVSVLAMRVRSPEFEAYIADAPVFRKGRTR